jgi:hypothetical protein
VAKYRVKNTQLTWRMETLSRRGKRGRGENAIGVEKKQKEQETPLSERSMRDLIREYADLLFERSEDSELMDTTDDSRIDQVADAFTKKFEFLFGEKGANVGDKFLEMGNPVNSFRKYLNIYKESTVIAGNIANAASNNLKRKEMQDIVTPTEEVLTDDKIQRGVNKSYRSSVIIPIVFFMDYIINQYSPPVFGPGNLKLDEYFGLYEAKILSLLDFLTVGIGGDKVGLNTNMKKQVEREIEGRTSEKFPKELMRYILIHEFEEGEEKKPFFDTLEVLAAGKETNELETYVTKVFSFLAPFFRTSASTHVSIDELNNTEKFLVNLEPASRWMDFPQLVTVTPNTLALAALSKAKRRVEEHATLFNDASKNRDSMFKELLLKNYDFFYRDLVNKFVVDKDLFLSLDQETGLPSRKKKEGTESLDLPLELIFKFFLPMKPVDIGNAIASNRSLKKTLESDFFWRAKQRLDFPDDIMCMNQNRVVNGLNANQWRLFVRPEYATKSGTEQKTEQLYGDFYGVYKDHLYKESDVAMREIDIYRNVSAQYRIITNSYRNNPIPEIKTMITILLVAPMETLKDGELSEVPVPDIFSNDKSLTIAEFQGRKYYTVHVAESITTMTSSRDLPSEVFKTGILESFNLERVIVLEGIQGIVQKFTGDDNALIEELRSRRFPRFSFLFVVRYRLEEFSYQRGKLRIPIFQRVEYISTPQETKIIARQFRRMAENGLLNIPERTSELAPKEVLLGDGEQAELFMETDVYAARKNEFPASSSITSISISYVENKYALFLRIQVGGSAILYHPSGEITSHSFEKSTGNFRSISIVKKNSVFNSSDFVQGAFRRTARTNGEIGIKRKNLFVAPKSYFPLRSQIAASELILLRTGKRHFLDPQDQLYQLLDLRPSANNTFVVPGGKETIVDSVETKTNIVSLILGNQGSVNITSSISLFVLPLKLVSEDKDALKTRERSRLVRFIGQDGNSATSSLYGDPRVCCHVCGIPEQRCKSKKTGLCFCSLNCAKFLRKR